MITMGSQCSRRKNPLLPGLFGKAAVGSSETGGPWRSNGISEGSEKENSPGRRNSVRKGIITSVNIQIWVWRDYENNSLLSLKVRWSRLWKALTDMIGCSVGIGISWKFWTGAWLRLIWQPSVAFVHSANIY